MEKQRMEAIQKASTSKSAHLKYLEGFLRIRSISTDPDHSNDMEKAAEWVMDKLSALGMENVRKFPTPKHPIVYGEYLGAPGAPTILVYGHYDVQPVDPVELWNSDPFAPEVRGENLHARGASDMKGQIAAVLCALESIRTFGKLPVNLKWLIEGEEEIGSPNLGAFISDQKDLLKSDFALNPDAGMISKEAPTITYGLRGLAYFELRVHCAVTDLHSGIFGGILHNPAIALAELIAGMHDAKGRITLPGFYDKVRKLSEEEREALARVPTDEKFYLETTGAPALHGEEGYTPNELTGARPTLDVNGLLSGFTGQGSKTVIPATAMAKISMRLVPDQEPGEVHKQLRQYLEEKAPKDIRWELIEMHGGKPSISDLNNTGVRAYAKALESVWGIKPYFKREGGSVPVVAAMTELAASGGYYVAVAADTIVAHPTSVTGSIGVIAVKLNAQGLMEKIGIVDETFKAGDKKDLLSPMRPATAEEREIIQTMLNAFHQRFKNLVRKGRPSITAAEIDTLADGRVYTADQALANKLVDEIGYLDDAIAVVKKGAGIKEARVVMYHRPWGYKNNIYSQLLRPEVENINLINLDLSWLLGEAGLHFMYLWAP